MTSNLRAELGKIINNSLSVDEFLDNFKIVIQHVKNSEKSLSEKIDKKCSDAEQQVNFYSNKLEKMVDEYQNTINQMKDDNETTLNNLKKWALQRVGDLFIKNSINDKLSEKLQEVNIKLAELNTIKTPSTRDVVDEAVSIVEERVLAKIPEQKSIELPKIPTIEDIEADLPKLGLEIRNALELLQDDERLDSSAIKGLDELIKKVEKLSQTKQTTTFVGGGSSGGGRIVKSYDLSDQLNGVTKVFSLPAMWRIISVLGSSAPAAGFRQTTDWVYDAGAHTLTFTNEIDASTTLAAGQVITLIFSE